MNGHPNVEMTADNRQRFHGAVANELNCDNSVSEIDLQSRYYVHFQTNTIRKGMNHSIHPAMG